MVCGDHILVRRGLYEHHGIDLGDGTVVHFSGGQEGWQKARSRVQRTPIEDFARGGAVEVLPYEGLDPARDAAACALGKLGASGYDLVFNNCEHFARWCKTGEQRARQVEKSAGYLGLPAACMGWGFVLSGILAEVGAIKGLSGAGVMSGLRAIGSPLALGAKGGLGVLGGGSAAIGFGLSQIAFRDDPHASPAERDARAVARTAAGLAGAGAVVVAELLAVPLNGPQLAATLKLAGGGNMTRGVVVVAVAPAVISLLLAVAAYFLSKAASSAELARQQRQLAISVPPTFA
jgi:hypothetical protein